MRDLRFALCVLATLATWGWDVGAQTPPTAVGTLNGRVVDSGTQRPVSDVSVSIVGFNREVLTDENGSFSLAGVPAGERTLELRHLSYGRHVRDVIVQPDEVLTLEARISSRAIELTPLLVETLSSLERRRITTGHQMNEVLRPEVDAVGRTGQTLADALRQRLPGVSMRGGRFGGACVEYRGARSAGNTCRELTVFLDGVRIADPGLLFVTMPPTDVERMELLSPAEAGARYGSVSGNGVLLIETRRGPQRQRTSTEDEARRTGFDWTGEPRPYDWERVLWSSFAANALAVGASLVLADRCLWRAESGSLGLRTRCGGAATVGIATLGTALPALAGTLAARWGGETPVSRGRVAPVSLTTALGVTAGYLFVIHGTPTSEAVGGVVLGLGVPVLTALADRMFRALR